MQNSITSHLVKSPWFAILFLISLSIVLPFIDDSWLYTCVGWLDPWIYVGYGYTFGDSKFGGFLKHGYYKMSRVPWIYLQYLARKFFSPLTATYILQYFCLWLGVFAVYFSIRRLLGHVPAFIAAIFLCLYRPFLGSGGADYHNTLVGPLYALSFLVLTIAAQDEKKGLRWLVLFGFVYALTVHTMILYINFIPILILHFFLARKVFCKTIISFRNLLFASLCGFLFATLICGLISVAYGYKFLFFLPQLGITRHFLYGNWVTSPWWESWSSGWLLNAYWLAPLAIAMIFSFSSFIFKWRGIKDNPTTFLAHSLNLQFLFIGLIWIFWQLLKKDTLNTSYFSYPLIIPFVMSMAANYSLCLSKERYINNYLPVVLGIVTIGALIFKFQFFLLNLFKIAPALLVLLSFCCFFIVLSFAKRQRIMQCASATFGGTARQLLSGENSSMKNGGQIRLVAATVLLALTSTTPWYYYTSTPQFSVRDSYLAVVEASRWIYTNYREAKEIFIWFDENDSKALQPSLSALAYSLANTTFAYVHPAFPMPSIQNLKLEELKATLLKKKKKVVVLITNEAKHVEEMQDRLKQIDIHLDLAQSHEVCVGQICLPIYVLKG